MVSTSNTNQVWVVKFLKILLLTSRIYNSRSISEFWTVWFRLKTNVESAEFWLVERSLSSVLPSWNWNVNKRSTLDPSRKWQRKDQRYVLWFTWYSCLVTTLLKKCLDFHGLFQAPLFPPLMLSVLDFCFTMKTPNLSVKISAPQPTSSEKWICKDVGRGTRTRVNALGIAQVPC